MIITKILSAIFNIPKSKQEWKNFIVMAGAVLIVIPICMSFGESTKFNSIEFKSAYNTKPSEMKRESTVYEFKNAVLENCYDINYDDANRLNKHYFLVTYFENESSEKVYTASLELDSKDGEIFEKALEAYENNTPLKISFCATIKDFNNKSENNDLFSQYKNAHDKYKSENNTIQNSDVRLEYRFDEKSEFDSYLLNQKEFFRRKIISNLIATITGIILLTLGLIFIKRTPHAKNQHKGVKGNPTNSDMQTQLDDRFNYIFDDDYYNRVSDDFNYPDK